MEGVEIVGGGGLRCGRFGFGDDLAVWLGMEWLESNKEEFFYYEWLSNLYKVNLNYRF